MATLTITEALQQIKTSLARIASKRGEVTSRVAQDSRMVDPLQNQGGTREFIKAALQSVQDLEKRIVALRVGINQANLNSSVEINGDSRTVAEWLVWKRELVSNQQTFFVQVSRNIQTGRNNAGTANRTLQAGAAPVDVTVFIDERKFAADTEHLNEVLSVLDGRLSAFNATHTIEVAD